jgi:hypothetical protein
MLFSLSVTVKESSVWCLVRFQSAHTISVYQEPLYRDIESDIRELHPGLASRFWCSVTPSTLIFAVLKDFCLSSSQQSIRVQTILCVSRKMIVDDWKYIAVLRCGTCRVTRYLSSDWLWRNRQLMTEGRKTHHCLPFSYSSSLLILIPMK